jgi:hypothetical protein
MDKLVDQDLLAVAVEQVEQVEQPHKATAEATQVLLEVVADYQVLAQVVQVQV